MPVKANNIYLIPTGKTIRLKNGKLKLEAKLRDHQPNNAIDIFFESLAKDRQTKQLASYSPARVPTEQKAYRR